MIDAETLAYARHDLCLLVQSLNWSIKALLLREREEGRIRELERLGSLCWRAARLSEQVLDYAQASDRESESETSPSIICVGELVQRSLDDLSLGFAIRNPRGRIELRAEDDVLVLGGYSLLYRSVVNIIANAVDFCADDSTINVTIARVADRVQIAVVNRLKEPGKDRRGCGIGLKFVSLTAQRHGGRFQLEFTRDHMARALIELPCAVSERIRTASLPVIAEQVQI
jgi:signal transduction histidine kinase